jgi:GNAT superfamily N-acetyltransferase
MERRARYLFDHRWSEDATLADGTRVVIRVVRPDDKFLLAQGFANLSPTSRYLRFFTAKQELTELELARLTEFDGVDRLAVGAVRELPDGRREGLGIARFARNPAVPTMAEAAVTVADAFQGKGLGTLLLARLADAARERGIICFSSEFLVGNAAVRQLIEEACPDARLSADGDVIRAEVPLASPTCLPSQAPGARPLRHLAGGRLECRLRHLLLKDPEHSL